jgi:hypothetical protein
LSVQLLPNEKWWAQMVEDVRKGTAIEVSSFMYDDSVLQQALERRLRAGASVHVSICRESFGGSTPKQQRSRIAALRVLGAKVFLCKGDKPGGIHHKKGVVVDRRVAYCGGPNLTTKSRKNGEQCFKMVGPIVSDILHDIVCARTTGAEWDGH